MNRYFWKGAASLLVLFGLLQTAGCSRSVLNYQIAESIGTLGKYENNEPVETPQMKMKREQEEQAESEEQALLDTIAQADRIAAGYEYEKAAAYLQEAEIDKNDDRVVSAIASYQQKQSEMYEYDGDIPHLSFPNLIVDPERAFDGSTGYGDVMITLSEFEGILEQLHDNGYFLIDIHSLVGEGEDEEGRSTLVSRNPVIPKGKKPMILSVDNLNYSQVENGKGVATRLTLDDKGEVKAVYTDAGGHDLTGDYDVVPVLETFIEENPDFSFCGARGIIGVSGSEGVFGYEIEDDGTSDLGDNREMVKEIAKTLAAGGWTFACEGYAYDKMGNYSFEQLTEDITSWKTTAGNLLGETDTLIFPYGSEVDYASEKAAWLVNEGFRYFIGLWAEEDFREVKTTYLRQTRRMANGYVFENSPGVFSTFFDVQAILDEAR